MSAENGEVIQLSELCPTCSLPAHTALFHNEVWTLLTILIAYVNTIVCIMLQMPAHYLFLVSCFSTLHSRKWCTHCQNEDELSWYGGIKITAIHPSLKMHLI